MFAVAKKFLLKLARKVLVAALAKIIAESNIVQGIIDRIKSFFSPLKNAWQDPAADEFVADVQRELIPALEALVKALLMMNSSISGSIEAVDNADLKCRNTVGDMKSAFDKIRV